MNMCGFETLFWLQEFDSEEHSTTNQLMTKSESKPERLEIGRISQVGLCPTTAEILRLPTANQTTGSVRSSSHPERQLDLKYRIPYPMYKGSLFF